MQDHRPGMDPTRVDITDKLKGQRGRVVRARPFVPVAVAEQIVSLPSRRARQQQRMSGTERRRVVRKRQRLARRRNR